MLYLILLITNINSVQRYIIFYTKNKYEIHVLLLFEIVLFLICLMSFIFFFLLCLFSPSYLPFLLFHLPCLYKAILSSKFIFHFINFKKMMLSLVLHSLVA